MPHVPPEAEHDFTLMTCFRVCTQSRPKDTRGIYLQLAAGVVFVVGAG